MSEAISDTRLRQLRDTAWTAAGYLYWQRGDPDERKREVWEFIKSKRLGELTRSLIEQTEPPLAIAAREVKN